VVDGKELTFHLAGINNQNFLMRDEETGSFWQQINGRAVSGPMAGKQLELVHCDELSFGLWRAENPRGTVLQPVGEFEKNYEAKDWEKRMLKARTVVDTSKSGIAPRALMLGIEVGGGSKAFPLDRVLQQKLVQDRVGGKAIILVVGPDNLSVRAFLRDLDGVVANAEYYRKPDSGLFVDSETGSEWNFQGCAVSGRATGRCLKPIPMIKDYWFDWQLYHPSTAVYKF
jgi:hypothetical protein